ncbi:MAG: hypothetical protein IPN47_27365 [Gemmatimonadetes bacterium]|nr:hypothetical protein [Gemmatimonadota bacterium]
MPRSIRYWSRIDPRARAAAARCRGGVAVVNERFAVHFFGAGDAVGRTFRLDSSWWWVAGCDWWGSG